LQTHIKTSYFNSFQLVRRLPEHATTCGYHVYPCLK